MKHGPLCENFSGLSEHLRSALRIVIELNAKVECKGLLGKYHLIDSHDAIDLTDLSKSDVFTQFKRRAQAQRSGVKNLFFSISITSINEKRVSATDSTSQSITQVECHGQTGDPSELFQTESYWSHSFQQKRRAADPRDSRIFHVYKKTILPAKGKNPIAWHQSYYQWIWVLKCGRPFRPSYHP